MTDRTTTALEVAGDIASHGDGRITLLHVIETIAGSDVDDELSTFYTKLEQRASRRLTEILSGVSNKGPIDTEIVYGKRVEEVLRFIRANAVDLIVLASHPVDSSQPYGGLGTMSYKLGILAPCAVLLVK